ncbi:MAG: alkaline phosphatase D family protein, partial [Planctomycetaceae bacterium]
TIAKTKMIVPGWTAPFRVPNWDATKTVPYRVRYLWNRRPKDKAGNVEAFWSGTIRRDHVDKETIIVAGFTGNHNNAGSIGSRRTNWKTGMFFPHQDLTKQVVKHKPDLLFFSGDQVYEGRSPTFADRKNIKLDYMYKWYLWVLAYRHLTKDIPAITIPDDHDIYQGNIWGQGGRKSPGRDHHGGYVHPADFVKMVERTQTSHLPDPFDPTPVKQGIGVYYSHLVWGRISIAILEDRKFKSGCARPDMPKSGTGRPDHFNNPKFDVKKLDIPGLELLGKRQEKFLKVWGTDWRGADMKMAVSQTIFANMATHHGPRLQYLIADLDSNGWPQSGRNRAVDLLRRAFAFHLAGDQHLATLVHHGIDDFGDAIWSFCVPSVANFYPRAWAPESRGKYVYPKPKQYLGKRRDGFGHPVIVYAVTNPGVSTGHKPAALHDRMPGYGIVKLNKTQRTITFECWPRWANPDNPKHKPYFGWPKTISQLDNYRRKPAGYLPTIRVTGMTDPVVQVINEKTGETVYAVRIKGKSFRPFVFQKGKYTVRVGELGTKRVKVLKGLEIGTGRTLGVQLPVGTDSVK